MKMRIAFVALIMVTFVIIGCAGAPITGSQVAVDRHGYVQPAVIVDQPSENKAAFTGYVPNLAFPKYYFGGSLITVNLEGFKMGPMPFTQNLNQDGSFTVFASDKFRVLFGPITDGRP